MSKSIRQLIQKGDPKLSVVLPKKVKEFIKAAAKDAKRSPQDEVIKRLAATLKNEEAFAVMQSFLMEHVKTVY